MTNLINPNSFVKFGKSDPQIEIIKEGNLAYVAGLQAFPISEADPYTQRVYAFVHLVNEDEAINTDKGLFVVDPSFLVNIEPEENARLVEQAQDRAVEIVGEQSDYRESADAATD